MTGSKKIRRIDFYHDEYIAGVGGTMSAENQGVYWMICSLIFSHGGAVDNDAKRIGRLVCLGPSKTRRIINDLVSEQKLTVNGTKLTQKRAENELERAQKRIENASRNGQKGGRPPKENNDLPEPPGLNDGKLTNNEQPPTNNHQPKVSIDPKEKKDAKPRPKKTRIADDWKPNGKAYSVGDGEGYTSAEVEFLSDGFRDWANEKGGLRANWNLSFYNWIRSDISRRNIQSRRQFAGQGAQGNGSFASVALEIAGKVKRKL